MTWWPLQAGKVLIFLLLNKNSPRPNQSILNISGCIYGKHRLLLHGARDGFFPRLQHALHLLPCVAIDQRVRIHEGLVEVARQKDCVRRADIFHDGIKHKEGRELSLGRDLWWD